MQDDLQLNNILFLDIETVPQFPSYKDIPERLQLLWDKKARIISKDLDPDPEIEYRRAGIFAEFGKIVCVSVGYIVKNQDDMNLRITSYYGEDEKVLLENFKDLLAKHFNTKQHFLCAHNGKEFDFPYLARRMLIKGISLPNILDMAGKKPWEIRHLDTLELWKFGDFKNYTSLELLTAVFDIPTPKDDIDGSMIRIVYWEEKDLERIKTYCQKDVIALTQLFLKYQSMNLFSEEQIQIIPS